MVLTYELEVSDGMLYMIFTVSGKSDLLFRTFEQQSLEKKQKGCSWSVIQIVLLKTVNCVCSVADLRPNWTLKGELV